MAFEKLYSCTDQFFEKAKWYARNDKFKEETITYECALIYYETVLMMPKFKDQRLHFQRKLFEACPGIYKGYFKLEYPGGPKIKS